LAPQTGPIQARLLCIRANALYRIGDLEGSIAALREGLAQIHHDFDREHIHYDEALAGMELAGLYLEQGRTADVKRLVLQMEPVFQSQGVHEEARRRSTCSVGR
jgi:ATP/maltotriose-dependent transcriptional regulator MalT